MRIEEASRVAGADGNSQRAGEGSDRLERAGKHRRRWNQHRATRDGLRRRWSHLVVKKGGRRSRAICKMAATAARSRIVRGKTWRLARALQPSLKRIRQSGETKEIRARSNFPNRAGRQSRDRPAGCSKKIDRRVAVRKFKRRQNECLFCRWHPGGNPDTLVPYCGSKSHFTHVNAAFQKCKRASAGYREATWRREHSRRQRAQSR